MMLDMQVTANLRACFVQAIADSLREGVFKSQLGGRKFGACRTVKYEIAKALTAC